MQAIGGLAAGPHGDLHGKPALRTVDVCSHRIVNEVKGVSRLVGGFALSDDRCAAGMIAPRRVTAGSAGGPSPSVGMWNQAEQPFERWISSSTRRVHRTTFQQSTDEFDFLPPVGLVGRLRKKHIGQHTHCIHGKMRQAYRA